MLSPFVFLTGSATLTSDILAIRPFTLDRINKPSTLLIIESSIDNGRVTVARKRNRSLVQTEIASLRLTLIYDYCRICISNFEAFSDPGRTLDNLEIYLIYKK